jgi:Inner membrane component of T3SS, cytoplasmic domain
MSELTLLILRIAFLLVMWGFVFAIVYALRSDLFGERVRRLEAEQNAQVVPDSPFASVPVTPGAPLTQSPLSARPSPSGPPTEVLRPGSGPTPTTNVRLVLVSGPKSGTEIPLGSEPLTIGRSAESGLVLRDDYTSTHHARLLMFNGRWSIQDLDSTNGTYLDGQRVTVPTPVPFGSQVRVGATTFELRG